MKADVVNEMANGWINILAGGHPATLAANDSMWSFPIFPTGAASEASRVDPIFFGLLIFSGIMVGLILAAILYFICKYRAGTDADRSNPIGRIPRYEITIEIIWITIPTVIMIFFFGWAAHVYFQAEIVPAGAQTIYVVAKQWMWKIDHPQGQREINELHVPLGRKIKLVMTSQDVIHSFYVPAFRLKQDVLPDRYTTLWFKANQVGTYHLFCAEYCGTEHSHMGGKVVVMTPADYSKWLSPQAPPPGAVPGTPGTPKGRMVLNGQGTFFKLGCNACHISTAAVRAPRLDGLFGHQVRLINGSKITADEQYIRQSILYPNKKIVAGYPTPSLMPSYKGRVSERQIEQLIEFIKSIQHGWPANVRQDIEAYGDSPPGNAPHPAEKQSTDSSKGARP